MISYKGSPLSLPSRSDTRYNVCVYTYKSEQSGISEECSTSVRHLVSMIPEWWSRCQVRMCWEVLEQGSERESDSSVCIRIAQVGTKSPKTNREVTAKIVEDEILTLVNHIREQCFQHAEDFAPGDVRYQGFEDREGLGKNSGRRDPHTRQSHSGAMLPTRRGLCTRRR
jgi:hypothetical protein